MVEDPVDGFESKVASDAKSGFTVTNAVIQSLADSEQPGPGGSGGADSHEQSAPKGGMPQTGDSATVMVAALAAIAVAGACAVFACLRRKRAGDFDKIKRMYF